MKMAKKPNSVGSDYVVGRGRPPLHSRFQRGRSGNPRGRPKGRLSQGALMRKILRQTITIREGEKSRKVSKYEAMLATLIHKALKGDVKAFQAVSNMIKDDPVALEPPPQLVLVFGKEEDEPNS